MLKSSCKYVAGIVTGVGLVHGKEVLFVANDATVKGLASDACSVRFDGRNLPTAVKLPSWPKLAQALLRWHLLPYDCQQASPCAADRLREQLALCPAWALRYPLLLLLLCMHVAVVGGKRRRVIANFLASFLTTVGFSCLQGVTSHMMKGHLWLRTLAATDYPLCPIYR